METNILKTEFFLRLFSLLLWISTACLVGLDTQTKRVFFAVERKATYRDTHALPVLVIVVSIAAGYNLIQLCKWVIFYWFMERRPEGGNKWLAWVCFLLDQTVAYVSFAANSAATEASVLAITGASPFHWTKVCNIYTRFCEQIAGGLLCGYAASLIMAVVSSLSAFHLYKLYSKSQDG